MEERKNRKSPRLKEYDYTKSGAYFVTFVTKNREKVLSEIVGAGLCARPHVHLTEIGSVTESAVNYINNYEDYRVDKYIIMPNHVHLLIQITAEGGHGDPPLQDVIGRLKSFVEKYYNGTLWQRSFYDHVIRNEDDYLNIWNYIDGNPSKWCEDKYYR